ncbi:hypothetical protein Dimus_036611 [Dionaea muscipula]
MIHLPLDESDDDSSDDSDASRSEDDSDDSSSSSESSPLQLTYGGRFFLSPKSHSSLPPLSRSLVFFSSSIDGGRGPARHTAAKSAAETSIATVVGDVRAARFAPAKHILVKGWIITFRRAGNCRRACGFIGCRCRRAGRALSGWRSVGSERSVDVGGRAFGSESSFGMDFCSTCGKLLQYDKTKKEEAPKPNKERKVTCPKCSHDKPEYHEIQIESADEPNAKFYRCPKCSHEWPHEYA